MIYCNNIITEDNEFSLTGEQDDALDRIEAWYKAVQLSPARQKFLVLSGAAGTGKSSLIRHVITRLGLPRQDVACCAFTGKAALNINRKGAEACTLHSLMYRVERLSNGEFRFRRRDSIQQRLVIVDEASMISLELFEDLVHYGRPVIFIGDHHQLPPIDDGFSIMSSPDIVLHEIHRQALENPIIRQSQNVVNGIPIPYGGRDRRFRKIRLSELQEEDLAPPETSRQEAPQVLVGTNGSRKTFNSLIRELNGMSESSPPLAGEKMIVLRNNYKHNLFNGQIVYLTSTPVRKRGKWLSTCQDEMAVLDPSVAFYGVREKEIEFTLGGDRMDNAPQNELFMDYGYAITVHKAQGSQWDDAVIIDDGFGRGNDSMRGRWLYTAITRARRNVLLVTMN